MCRDDGEMREYSIDRDIELTAQQRDSMLMAEPHRSARKHPEPIDDHHQSLNKTIDISSELVAPSSPPPSRFTSKWWFFLPHGSPKNVTESRKRLPRAVKVYYRRQKKDMQVLLDARKLSVLPSDSKLDDRYSWLAKDGEPITRKKSRCCNLKSCHCINLSVGTAARLTFAVNVFLLFIKLAAAVQSGSLSVLSSLLDSALDLFSGLTIGVSSYLIRRYDRFHYPIGRNRLESVAIVITAAVMGTAALQIVTKAIENISEANINPNINAFSGSIIGLTVLLKGSLYLLCRQVDNPSVQTLAVDHRNDIATNIATLIFGLLGTHLNPLIDPIGAILLAFYIIINWVIVAYDQIKNLVGHTADRRFLSKITWIAANHDARIETVDTVRAYTFGVNYLVEVDVQLAPDMPLMTAHDIGEHLQQKLESMDEVERAFVHLDFETVHSPTSEHKLPHLF